MRKLLRIAKTVKTTADSTVGVVDHVHSKARSLILWIALAIFGIIAGVIAVITGSISLFV